MQITVAIVVMALTLVAGQITKMTKLDNKWIPLQNIIIAVISSIICIIFKVQDMSVLETIITCIFATMSAGGIADLGKVRENIRSLRESRRLRND